jgi:hypothetical protein
MEYFLFYCYILKYLLLFQNFIYIFHILYYVNLSYIVLVAYFYQDEHLKVTYYLKTFKGVFFEGLLTFDGIFQHQDHTH